MSFDNQVRTDHEEQPERLYRVFNLGQEFRRKSERQCDLRWLIEICLQDSPKQGNLADNSLFQNNNIYLLKIKKLSKTWSSCLLGTERRILS